VPISPTRLPAPISAASFAQPRPSVIAVAAAPVPRNRLLSINALISHSYWIMAGTLSKACFAGISSLATHHSLPATLPVRRYLPVIAVLLLSAAGWTAWFMRDTIRQSWERLGQTSLKGPQAPRPRPKDYQALVEDTERWRKDLADRYHKSTKPEDRDKVLKETRAFLETLLPSMMRCWLGTPWDFNGTAEGPGKDPIACGYFVATVLRDAGFRVDRYKLAKQPSENILRTFLPRRALLRRVGVPYETFAAEARSLDPGIYIIGLDTHVAFLVAENRTFRFIHSSGSQPWCVVDEGETEAAVLKSSNYRILGNLSADRRVLTRWLLEQPLPVHGAN
jgi:hypothetical protein